MLYTIPPTTKTPLQQLRAGNDRFAAGLSIHPRQNSRQRAELLGEQRPVAIVVGCSDSRVPLEIVFDQGLGDLYGCVVAGNVR